MLLSVLNGSVFQRNKHLYQETYFELDKGNSILDIYIDFTKEFVTVWQDILLNKLYHYGIRGNVQK